ncbi:hypothetical protein GIB67_029917 [Kingdonia uniflora]|uniref:Polygalacturonase n=1 Tax=Kingdonia uniflora TaxID=39325 RepID=A0A7J7M6T4_9MAGN|nr:hypothetical protein GIB67_029917 [Kingdonia uniflora]
MGSSSNLLKVCLSMLVFAWVANAHNKPGVYNVMHYGAVADGKTDCANVSLSLKQIIYTLISFWNEDLLKFSIIIITNIMFYTISVVCRPFLSAWTQACACNGRAWILIPLGTFLSSAVSFKGPCKSALVFQIRGKVVAPVDLLGDNWISFEYVKGLTLTDGGTFDGQGSVAWGKKNTLGFLKFPVNIRFKFCTDAIIRRISSINSKLFHIDVLGCKNIRFIAINVSAPKTSVPTLVKISDVIFKNIRCTYTSKLAVKLMCSLRNPCDGVQIGDIDLMYMGSSGPAHALCTYAKFIFSGNIFPSTCF